jgi:hypothetical protein
MNGGKEMDEMETEILRDFFNWLAVKQVLPTPEFKRVVDCGIRYLKR